MISKKVDLLVRDWVQVTTSDVDPFIITNPIENDFEVHIVFDTAIPTLDATGEPKYDDIYRAIRLGPGDVMERVATDSFVYACVEKTVANTFPLSVIE